MPITPLHYPFAFLISKVNRRLSLPGLVVGSVIPDIEVPIMWTFFPDLLDHLFLHSLVGALTVGTLLAVVVTRFLYPPIVSILFRVDRERMKQVSQITPLMIVSCLIGVVSHLILDFPMHWYNPILWPWVNPIEIIGPLVLFFMSSYDMWTSYSIASSITHVAMLALWSAILVLLYSKGNLWNRHWVADDSSEEYDSSDRDTTLLDGRKPLF